MRAITKIFSSRPHSAPWETRIAIFLVVFVGLLMAFQAQTECALGAASCPQGTDQRFNDNIAWKSDTNYEYTLDHAITADRTLGLPDGAVAKGSIMAGTGANQLELLAVGSDGEYLVANSSETTGLEWSAGAAMATGQYTGNGATSYTPPDACGFAPKYVSVWDRQTTTATFDWFWTTDVTVDNHANGLAVTTDYVANTMVTQDDRIIAFTATSFTVDDNGADEHPNTSGTVYEFICIGG